MPTIQTPVTTRMKRMYDGFGSSWVVWNLSRSARVGHLRFALPECWMNDLVETKPHAPTPRKGIIGSQWVGGPNIVSHRRQRQLEDESLAGRVVPQVFEQAPCLWLCRQRR